MSEHNTRLAPAQSLKHIRFANTLPDFVAARGRCSVACRAYNELSVDATHEERAKCWLDIVDPARVHHSVPSPSTAPSLHTSEIDESSSDDHFTSKQTSALPLVNVAPLLEPAIPKVKQPIIMEYGLRVHIDPTAFINFNCTILDTPVADIIIGARVLIGPNVGLYGVSHSMATDPKNGLRSCRGGGIVIEDRVWIGGDSIVLVGVRIGHDSVIGARSVVTKDIPPFSFALGSPAKVIRKIKPEEEAPDADEYEASSLYEALMIGQDGGTVAHNNVLAAVASVSEFTSSQNKGHKN